MSCKLRYPRPASSCPDAVALRCAVLPISPPLPTVTIFCQLNLIAKSFNVLRMIQLLDLCVCVYWCWLTKLRDRYCVYQNLTSVVTSAEILDLFQYNNLRVCLTTNRVLHQLTSCTKTHRHLYLLVNNTKLKSYAEWAWPDLAHLMSSRHTHSNLIRLKVCFYF